MTPSEPFTAGFEAWDQASHRVHVYTQAYLVGCAAIHAVHNAWHVTDVAQYESLAELENDVLNFLPRPPTLMSLVAKQNSFRIPNSPSGIQFKPRCGNLADSKW